MRENSKNQQPLDTLACNSANKPLYKYLTLKTDCVNFGPTNTNEPLLAQSVLELFAQHSIDLRQEHPEVTDFCCFGLITSKYP